MTIRFWQGSCESWTAKTCLRFLLFWYYQKEACRTTAHPSLLLVWHQLDECTQLFPLMIILSSSRCCTKRRLAGLPYKKRRLDAAVACQAYFSYDNNKCLLSAFSMTRLLQYGSGSRHVINLLAITVPALSDSSRRNTFPIEPHKQCLFLAKT